MEALTPYLANQRNQICIKLYTRVFKFLQNSTQRSGRDKAESDSAVFIPHDYAKSGFLVCIAHLVQLFYTRVFKKKKKTQLSGVGMTSRSLTLQCSLHRLVQYFTQEYYDFHETQLNAESDSAVFIAQLVSYFTALSLPAMPAWHF